MSAPEFYPAGWCSARTLYTQYHCIVYVAEDLDAQGRQMCFAHSAAYVRAEPELLSGFQLLAKIPDPKDDAEPITKSQAWDVVEGCA